MPDQGDAAIAGDDQAQADQPQIGAFLFCLAALGDIGVGVGGVDERGEVGHVEGHGGGVEVEAVDDAYREAGEDLGELGGGDRVHGVPELAVLQRPGADLGESVSGGGGPPGGQLSFARGIDQPVERGDGQVSAHRQVGVGAAGTDYLVDEPGNIQVAEHAPGCGDVTEGEVAGAFGEHRLVGGVHRGGDVVGRAEVAFADHLRFSVDPAHLAQVVVNSPVDLLRVHARHDFRS